MGGIFFLLALTFAAATGGGILAFIIALIVLNGVGGAIRRAAQANSRRIRPRTDQNRPAIPAEWSQRWQEIGEWFERMSDWDGYEQRDRSGRPSRRRRERPEITESTDNRDDRYVRGRPSESRASRANRSLPPPTPSRSTRTTNTQRTTTARAESYPHAIEAVRRAGLDPQNAGLSLSDVGLIVYGAEPKPVVHRESAVPDTADYVQPFIELKAARAAKGRLTFEVVDTTGEIVYRREEDQQLRAGKTAVIPRTRLPIGDHFDLSQGWTLRIYANNVLIAEHPIGWYNPADRTETLREVMSNDGELTADLSALMDDIQAQPMSLDDLLGDDSASSQKQARR